MRRILIIEDEAAVAKGLIFGLKEEGYEVDWAASGEEGLRRTAEKPPHVLLLDLRLPGMDGFEVCRELRRKGHRFPILMLTARDEEVDKILGLELGADDYLVKPFSFRELLSRIHALIRRTYGELAGVNVREPVVLGEVKIDLERLQAHKGDQPLFLTPLEFKLLLFLVENADRPLSRERIIEGVWGYNDFSGDDRTVDVHIRHLREKLEENPSKPRHILTVRGFGYKFSLD